MFLCVAFSWTLYPHGPLFFYTMISLPFHTLTQPPMYSCSRKSSEKLSCLRFWTKLNIRKFFFLQRKNSQYPGVPEKYCCLLLSRVSENLSSHHVTTKQNKAKTVNGQRHKLWKAVGPSRKAVKGKSWGHTCAGGWEAWIQFWTEKHTTLRRKVLGKKEHSAHTFKDFFVPLHCFGLHFFYLSSSR